MMVAYRTMSDVSSWDWSRAIFDHVHLRVADLQRSRAFYAMALEPLGIPLLLDTPDLVAFANLALSAETAPSTGVHVAFAARSREEVDAFADATVLEFGATWCGYCQAAQPDIAAVMGRHPGVRHIKIEDGKGRPLGRSFRVKLWPTLIYLEAGVEKARVVRPGSAPEIEALFSGG